MDNTIGTNKSRGWAQIISDIFSPLLMPTYGMTIIMWVTDMRNIPERIRLICTLIVALITAVIPFVVLRILYRLGKVKDNAVSNRKERFLPFSAAIICYLSAAWTINHLGAPTWLTMFFIAAAAATLIAMIITAKWKISAHATAAGGVTGMVLWCTVRGLADVNAMIILSSVIIISGLVSSSRISLGRHTLGQVLAGLLLGTACTFGLMWI